MINLLAREPQEIFDAVVAHARTMDKKSIKCDNFGGHPVCAYRGNGGRKCFIGALIPDEEYDIGMEMPISSFAPKEMPYLSDESFKLLIELQSIHDLIPMDKWEEELKGVAGDFGLKYSPK